MNGEVLWRDTGLTPKIFILDARAIFPLALWLFHWSWWTAAIACLGIVALFFVQRSGMSPLACLRAIRTAFMGRRRETRYTKPSGANDAAGNSTTRKEFDMKDVPRNSFGLFDSPVRCREKERVSLTPRHIESQLDAGAFLMSRENAVLAGFLNPHDEQDSVIVELREENA